MSNIKVQASPTGTGVVTLTAPTTNTDRTVTLPDQTGTVYIAGGDIGTPSAGNGSNLTNLNASNLATGTVPTARLASGTANSTTYLRGDQTWAAVTSLPGYQGQVFTGSGTFTIPSGVTAIKVTVIGGGGGGGGSRSNTCQNGQGGGGGGGGTAVAYLTSLTPGNTLSVTVGAGGTAGASTPTSGGAGGTSSVASGTQTITTVSATGGSGGTAGNNASGTNGAGGGTSGASYGISGSAAIAGPVFTAGMSQMSNVNQKPSPSNTAGTSGVGFGYGTGATGGNTDPSAGQHAGATGAAGIVIIEW
jgi:hypothetical protein